jgi:hypothetical protein
MYRYSATGDQGVSTSRKAPRRRRGAEERKMQRSTPFQRENQILPTDMLPGLKYDGHVQQKALPSYNFVSLVDTSCLTAAAIRKPYVLSIYHLIQRIISNELTAYKAESIALEKI